MTASVESRVAPRTVLEVERLVVEFRRRRNLLGGGRAFAAVDDISFAVDEGETLAIVGESGSGKSTTGRALLRLVEPTSGVVRVNGVDLATLDGRELRRKRREIQMIFQDPVASLDPRMRVGAAVAEPLVVHENISKRDAATRATEVLRQVGLSPTMVDRLPKQLSGGQRQRVAIARAIVLQPSLVVCDEAVSALDVSTRNQIINLLQDLQAATGVAYVFIAHDLTLVRHLAHRVAVMYRGRIVEDGPVARVFDEPAHPYTRALLAATPIADPRAEKARRAQRTAAPESSGSNEPATGCTFFDRCPHATPACKENVPDVVPVDGGGTVRCIHHPIA
jgi:oligopeptide/dipeptide ABC transporter ATP-binding protein